MKKQFQHEAHKLQEKATKPDYRERFQDEGDSYDRGGVIRDEKRAVWIKGNTIHYDVRSLLNEDKKSLMETLSRRYKFIFFGNVGTISKLSKNPKIASQVIERFEMTQQSIRRALEIIDHVKHPKKNRPIPMLEFTCFLQPVEPFTNPVFERNWNFAFRMNIAKTPL